MSGRKRGREAGEASPAAWEPSLPTPAEGEAFLGALFGGAKGLDALITCDAATRVTCRAPG